jgi:hypothetical protein
MGKGNFAQKAPLQKSGNDVKSTNSQNGEGGPASDILENILTNPDGVMVSCKRKMAEPAKTTRPFSETGGGGRYMGRPQPSNLKFYIFTFSHLYNAASFRWKEKTVLDRQQPRPTVISGSSSK